MIFTFLLGRRLCARMCCAPADLSKPVLVPEPFWEGKFDNHTNCRLLYSDCNGALAFLEVNFLAQFKAFARILTHESW